MTEEDIKELLEAAKPSVIESLKKELSDGITYEAKAELGNQIRAHVKKWTQENIIPEITKSLIESKDGMISLGVKIGDAISEELVKGATASIKENMEQSYSRKQIFSALFN